MWIPSPGGYPPTHISGGRVLSTKPAASHVQVTFHEQGHSWHIAPHPNMEPRPNGNRVQVKLGNYQTCRKMYYKKRAIASKTCESSGSEPVPYIHVFPSWRCTAVLHAMLAKGAGSSPFTIYICLQHTYSKQASVSAWRLQSIPSREWIRDNHSTNGGLVGNWKNTSYFCCKPSARSRQPCSTSKILPSHRGSSSAGKPHSCRDSDFRCYNWSVHGVAIAKHTSQTLHEFKTSRPATETHENPLSKTHPKLTKTVLAKPSFTTSSLHSCMCNLPVTCPPKLEPLFISEFKSLVKKDKTCLPKKEHQLRTIRFDHLPKSTQKKRSPASRHFALSTTGSWCNFSLPWI